MNERQGAEGASDAHLFENPREIFVARRPEDVLPDLAIPLLLAHCSDDENLTPPNFERLRPLAPTGTTTWSEPCPEGLSKEHHLDGWMSPSYNQTVRAFLSALPSD